MLAGCAEVTWGCRVGLFEASAACEASACNCSTNVTAGALILDQGSSYSRIDCVSDSLNSWESNGLNAQGSSRVATRLYKGTGSFWKRLDSNSLRNSLSVVHSFSLELWTDFAIGEPLGEQPSGP
jgi:hypothetical protein